MAYSLLNRVSTQTNSRTEYFLYPFFALIAFAFLAVFSSHTSPFFNTYGGDSSVFIVLGKSFLEGKTPYVDFFDHKGPVMIFIQALGLSLTSHDRLAIFILQIINLTITQILIYKCARCFTSPINSLSTVLATLLIFSFTIEGGNMTEEYSLPFLLYTLLITLKISVNKHPFKPLQAFIIGVFAAILFWLRPNNMNVLCACALFISVLFAYRKQWKELTQLIGFGILGFVAFSLPLISYFIYIDAFDEMIYAAFTFNFQYSDIPSDETPESLIRSLILFVKRGMSLILLAIASVAYYFTNKDRKLLLLSVFLLIICYFTTFIGKQYPHYMTLNLPCFALGFAILLSLTDCHRLRYVSKTIFILSFAALAVYSIGKYNYPYYRETQDDSNYEVKVRTALKMIPPEDRNSIYTYQTSTAKFILLADIPVYFKYFTKQEWHATHAPHIIDEINEMMKKSPPKWIVTDFRKESDNYVFWEVVDNEYTLYYCSDNFQLYRKNT